MTLEELKLELRKFLIPYLDQLRSDMTLFSDMSEIEKGSRQEKNAIAEFELLGGDRDDDHHYIKNVSTDDFLHILKSSKNRYIYETLENFFIDPFGKYNLIKPFISSKLSEISTVNFNRLNPILENGEIVHNRSLLDLENEFGDDSSRFLKASNLEFKDRGGFPGGELRFTHFLTYEDLKEKPLPAVYSTLIDPSSTSRADFIDSQKQERPTIEFVRIDFGLSFYDYLDESRMRTIVLPLLVIKKKSVIDKLLGKLNSKKNIDYRKEERVTHDVYKFYYQTNFDDSAVLNKVIKVLEEEKEELKTLAPYIDFIGLISIVFKEHFLATYLLLLNSALDKANVLDHFRKLGIRNLLFPKDTPIASRDELENFQKNLRNYTFENTDALLSNQWYKIDEDIYNSFYESMISEFRSGNDFVSLKTTSPSLTTRLLSKKGKSKNTELLNNFDYTTNAFKRGGSTFERVDTELVVEKPKVTKKSLDLIKAADSARPVTKASNKQKERVEKINKSQRLYIFLQPDIGFDRSRINKVIEENGIWLDLVPKKDPLYKYREQLEKNSCLFVFKDGVICDANSDDQLTSTTFLESISQPYGQNNPYAKKQFEARFLERLSKFLDVGDSFWCEIYVVALGGESVEGKALADDFRELVLDREDAQDAIRLFMSRTLELSFFSDHDDISKVFDLGNDEVKQAFPNLENFTETGVRNALVDDMLQRILQTTIQELEEASQPPQLTLDFSEQSVVDVPIVELPIIDEEPEIEEPEIEEPEIEEPEIEEPVVQRNTLYLVSCTKVKKEGTFPAGEIYEASDWFTKAKAYVLQEMKKGDDWLILSAKHHLLHPDEQICDYNKYLANMRRAEKKEWAEKTLRQLLDLNISWKKVVFLAGSAYREFLENPLLESGITQEIEVPLKGLGIGQQKAKLKELTSRTETPVIVEEVQEETEPPVIVEEVQEETEPPVIVEEIQEEIEPPALIEELQEETEPSVLTEEAKELTCESLLYHAKIEFSSLKGDHLLILERLLNNPKDLLILNSISNVGSSIRAYFVYLDTYAVSNYNFSVTWDMPQNALYNRGELIKNVSDLLDRIIDSPFVDFLLVIYQLIKDRSSKDIDISQQIVFQRSIVQKLKTFLKGTIKGWDYKFNQNLTLIKTIQKKEHYLSVGLNGEIEGSAELLDKIKGKGFCLYLSPVPKKVGISAGDRVCSKSLVKISENFDNTFLISCVKKSDFDRDDFFEREKEGAAKLSSELESQFKDLISKKAEYFKAVGMFKGFLKERYEGVYLADFENIPTSSQEHKRYVDKAKEICQFNPSFIEAIASGFFRSVLLEKLNFIIDANGTIRFIALFNIYVEDPSDVHAVYPGRDATFVYDIPNYVRLENLPKVQSDTFPNLGAQDGSYETYFLNLEDFPETPFSRFITDILSMMASQPNRAFFSPSVKSGDDLNQYQSIDFANKVAQYLKTRSVTYTYHNSGFRIYNLQGGYVQIKTHDDRGNRLKIPKITYNGFDENAFNDAVSEAIWTTKNDSALKPGSVPGNLIFNKSLRIKRSRDDAFWDNFNLLFNMFSIYKISFLDKERSLVVNEKGEISDRLIDLESLDKEYKKITNLYASDSQLFDPDYISQKSNPDVELSTLYKKLFGIIRRKQSYPDFDFLLKQTVLTPTDMMSFFGSKTSSFISYSKFASEFFEESILHLINKVAFKDFGPITLETFTSILSFIDSRFFYKFSNLSKTSFLPVTLCYSLKSFLFREFGSSYFSNKMFKDVEGAIDRAISIRSDKVSQIKARGRLKKQEQLENRFGRLSFPESRCDLDFRTFHNLKHLPFFSTELNELLKSQPFTFIEEDLRIGLLPGQKLAERESVLNSPLASVERDSETTFLAFIKTLKENATFEDKQQALDDYMLAACSAIDYHSTTLANSLSREYILSASKGLEVLQAKRDIFASKVVMSCMLTGNPILSVPFMDVGPYSFRYFLYKTDEAKPFDISSTEGFRNALLTFIDEISSKVDPDLFVLKEADSYKKVLSSEYLDPPYVAFIMDATRYPLYFVFDKAERESVSSRESVDDPTATQERTTLEEAFARVQEATNIETEEYPGQRMYEFFVLKLKDLCSILLDAEGNLNLQLSEVKDNISQTLSDLGQSLDEDSFFNQKMLPLLKSYIELTIFLSSNKDIIQTSYSLASEDDKKIEFKKKKRDLPLIFPSVVKSEKVEVSFNVKELFENILFGDTFNFYKQTIKPILQTLCSLDKNNGMLLDLAFSKLTVSQRNGVLLTNEARKKFFLKDETDFEFLSELFNSYMSLSAKMKRPSDIFKAALSTLTTNNIITTELSLEENILLEVANKVNIAFSDAENFFSSALSLSRAYYQSKIDYYYLNISSKNKLNPVKSALSLYSNLMYLNNNESFSSLDLDVRKVTKRLKEWDAKKLFGSFDFKASQATRNLKKVNTLVDFSLFVFNPSLVKSDKYLKKQEAEFFFNLESVFLEKAKEAESIHYESANLFKGFLSIGFGFSPFFTTTEYGEILESNAFPPIYTFISNLFLRLCRPLKKGSPSPIFVILNKKGAFTGLENEVLTLFGKDIRKLDELTSYVEYLLEKASTDISDFEYWNSGYQFILTGLESLKLSLTSFFNKATQVTEIVIDTQETAVDETGPEIVVETETPFEPEFEAPDIEEVLESAPRSLTISDYYDEKEKAVIPLNDPLSLTDFLRYIDAIQNAFQTGDLDILTSKLRVLEDELYVAKQFAAVLNAQAREIPDSLIKAIEYLEALVSSIEKAQKSSKDTVYVTVRVEGEHVDLLEMNDLVSKLQVDTENLNDLLIKSIHKAKREQSSPEFMIESQLLVENVQTLSQRFNKIVNILKVFESAKDNFTEKDLELFKDASNTLDDLGKSISSLASETSDFYSGKIDRSDKRVFKNQKLENDLTEFHKKLSRLSENVFALPSPNITIDEEGNIKEEFYDLKTSFIQEDSVRSNIEQLSSELEDLTALRKEISRIAHISNVNLEDLIEGEDPRTKLSAFEMTKEQFDAFSDESPESQTDPRIESYLLFDSKKQQIIKDLQNASKFLDDYSLNLERFKAEKKPYENSSFSELLNAIQIQYNKNIPSEIRVDLVKAYKLEKDSWNNVIDSNYSEDSVIGSIDESKIVNYLTSIDAFVSQFSSNKITLEQLEDYLDSTIKPIKSSDAQFAIRSYLEDLISEDKTPKAAKEILKTYLSYTLRNAKPSYIRVVVLLDEIMVKLSNAIKQAPKFRNRITALIYIKQTEDKIYDNLLELLSVPQFKSNTIIREVAENFQFVDPDVSFTLTKAESTEIVNNMYVAVSEIVSSLTNMPDSDVKDIVIELFRTQDQSFEYPTEGLFFDNLSELYESLQPLDLIGVSASYKSGKPNDNFFISLDRFKDTEEISTDYEDFDIDLDVYMPTTEIPEADQIEKAPTFDTSQNEVTVPVGTKKTPIYNIFIDENEILIKLDEMDSFISGVNPHTIEVFNHKCLTFKKYLIILLMLTEVFPVLDTSITITAKDSSFDFDFSGKDLKMYVKLNVDYLNNTKIGDDESELLPYEIIDPMSRAIQTFFLSISEEYRKSGTEALDLALALVGRA